MGKWEVMEGVGRFDRSNDILECALKYKKIESPGVRATITKE